MFLMGFNKVFKRMTNKKQIKEAVLLVEHINGATLFNKGFGGKDINSPIIIASITKLFTAACIYILRDQGKINLNDRLTSYFNDNTLESLHIYKGRDYSAELTITHLLFQTSGLPDISEEGSDNLRKQVIKRDMAISFDEIIFMTKKLKPHFPPDVTNRAHYADVNFDLLGKIIENVTNMPLEEVFKQFIFQPLKLEKTYLPTKDFDFLPEIYNNNDTLHRPKYIRSCRASGGCISTARELMTFIKAFFNGKLFNKQRFNDVNLSHRLQFSMFPIRYGAGYMRIPLGGLGTFFTGKREVIGHSGSSGSFAFYYPRRELFFVGDLNQMANPALPVRAVLQLALAAK